MLRTAKAALLVGSLLSALLAASSAEARHPRYRFSHAKSRPAPAPLAIATPATGVSTYRAPKFYVPTIHAGAFPYGYFGVHARPKMFTGSHENYRNTYREWMFR